MKWFKKARIIWILVVLLLAISLPIGFAEFVSTSPEQSKEFDDLGWLGWAGLIGVLGLLGQLQEVGSKRVKNNKANRGRTKDF